MQPVPSRMLRGSDVHLFKFAILTTAHSPTADSVSPEGIPSGIEPPVSIQWVDFYPLFDPLTPSVKKTNRVKVRCWALTVKPASRKS